MHLVSRADIKNYNDENMTEPPSIKTVLIASYDTTPPDLKFKAQLTGAHVQEPIVFEKQAENVVKCVCKVFYHGTANNWTARLVFFPETQLEVCFKTWTCVQ